MTNKRWTDQQKGVAWLVFAVVLVVSLVIMAVTANASESGSFSVSSPDGGFRTDQSWFLFDGEGTECHVESWSVNNNRSLHDNSLNTLDTNGTTTHLAVERTVGTTDRGRWDSTTTGEVYLQLILGDDQRSSADYHAEWKCKEAPSTTQPPETTTTGGSTTTSTPPDTTVTTGPPSSTTSSTTTTEPPNTSTTSPTTTVPGQPTLPTVPPSTPTGVPTGLGEPDGGLAWYEVTALGLIALGLFALSGAAVWKLRHE